MATLSNEGFDCEFVEKPPEAVQSECPACEQIFREPYQISCCGNSFCRVCIERIKTDNTPCPTCNEENFATFHNKILQRSLYEFQVYCSHKQEGCEWKGKLSRLDNHLNLSPQPDKQLEGCEYSEIECIYCSELIKRIFFTNHQQNFCPKRPFSCEYCHIYKSHYEDVINNHLPFCGYYPVPCPNACGTFHQHWDLEDHITRDCPKTDIDCDFHHVGCDVRLPREDMPVHLNENLVTHMSLQVAGYNTLLASFSELQAQVLRLQLEKQAMGFKTHGIPTPTVTHGIPTLGYVEFTMENFEPCKTDNCNWFSPPFYSHQGGYKFCLSVDANGYGPGKGTHISVWSYLMKGEFDDRLKWPFRGRITVQLVDQEGEEKHRTKKISYTDQTSEDYAGRMTQKRRNKAWGYHQFLSHDELKPNYLKNDRLCLRVTKFKFP